MGFAVTGATGQLGTLVIAEILARGIPASEIIALVRDPRKALRLQEQGITVRQANYTDPPSLVAALAGVDRLLLISSDGIGQRLAQHKNVIDSAKTSGVKFIAYTSILQADTSQLTLAPEHKATEEYLVSSGVTHTLLRNGWYTENYAGNLSTARQTGTVVGITGNGKVSSASRSDYAEAAAIVLTDAVHDGAVFELSGDVAWSYEELAAALSSVIDREVIYQQVSTETYTQRLIDAGLDRGVADFLTRLELDAAQGLLSLVTGDLSRLIGRPTTPLREGLAQLV
ncbi:SDR family oxidoreductase [Lysinibacter sp. HNR]|uniref:SDR family oxidoreductase n=1 Tax=Lysinibacter sp. HNR TaxID=3031408 RepID=UPI002434ED32|nr:SDR family oxidoreductase [Lysinibacter sp. HNR]WGD36660.1 SDR family oxidoreductase [Lysinibacter sp. HNR]